VIATATAAAKGVMLIGGTSGRRQVRWTNAAATCTTGRPIPGKVEGTANKIKTVER
jgi:hypothetical protein